MLEQTNNMEDDNLATFSFDFAGGSTGIFGVANNVKNKAQSNKQLARHLQDKDCDSPLRRWAHFIRNKKRKRELTPEAKELQIKQEQCEWLIDCYRMRVHDDMQWCGGNMRGAYNPDSTPASICTDFLLWMKLCARREALPLMLTSASSKKTDLMNDEDQLFDFDFACCLEKAADLLPLRFQKEHAKRK